MQASCVLSPQARTLSLGEACSKARARPVETDARTHMLLAKPIAPTILRLAVPNSTVMIVQILIGLLEVYFVSRTGVDALAGVSPVFPLFRWWSPSRKARSVAASSRPLHVSLGPAGSAMPANTPGTRSCWVFRSALRRQPSWLRWVQPFTRTWVSPEMLWRSPSLIP